MKLTIAKKITLGFVTSIVITAGLGSFTYLTLNGLTKAVDIATTNAFPSIIAVQRLQTLQRQNVTNVTQHILATEDAMMSRVEGEMAEVSKQIRETVASYDSNITAPEERQLFDTVKRARESYLQIRTDVLKLSKEKKNAEALAMFYDKFLPTVKLMDAAIQAEVDYNQQMADRSSAEMRSLASSGRTGVMIGVGIAVLAGIGIAWGTIRSINSALGKITQSLTSGSVQVNAASSQVAAASQSLASGASEQAASLEETSSSLEEISSMTKKNADTAHQASVLSTEAKAVADKGNTAMAKMSGAIADIQKSAAETAKIIKTIDEIAFQTNLLALNAAVEAARAGEAGKGFAVVAEEVRNLAMRSAEAAKNTAALIDGSVTNAKNGVVIADEVAKNLEEITATSGKVNLLIAEIAAACQEQSTGIGTVNQSIQEMDKVTQSNAAAAEESAASAEELSTQSEQLSRVVSDLTCLIVGTGAITTTAAPARTTVRTAKAPSVSHKTHTFKAPAAPKIKRNEIPLEDADTKNDDFADFNIAA